MDLPAGPPTATPEPSRPLAPAARWLWRLEGLVAARRRARRGRRYCRARSAARSRCSRWVAAALIGVAAVGVAPELRWRRWRWEVREHEIDIRHGTVAVTRTLVPMLRVQHVDTKRDLLQQWLGLATVVFHTAAGANQIPALTVAEAGDGARPDRRAGADGG